MKSFEKFNVEAMVHHIALEEGMSYEELSEQLAGDMPGGLGGAIMTGVIGAGGWALRNLKRALTDTRPVFRDYGQGGDSFAASTDRPGPFDRPKPKVTTSGGGPAIPAGKETKIGDKPVSAPSVPKPQPTTPKPKPEPKPQPTQTTTSGASPTPPKPPKKPSLKKTAAVLATAAAPAGSTRTASVDKADPHDMKPKPEGPPPPKPLNPEDKKAAESIFKLKPGSLSDKKPEEPKKPKAPTPITPKPEGPPPTPRPIPQNRRRTSPATHTTTGIPIF